MRFQRLVIEADENTFSLDFHDRLTVISGVGRLEREGLISEMVGSLSSSRPGVHAEIEADNGNRFAVFRPYGARARVIDIESSTDVSSRFADGEGHIDLLAVAGLDVRGAKRALRLTSSDLVTSTNHDQIVRRLALVDPAALWEAMDRVRATQAVLDATATESGSAPEDAAVVAQIEERHTRFEEAQARAERSRKASFICGAVSALAAVPSAMLLGRTIAMLWIILAAAVTALSFIQNQRMERAGTAEREALAAAGAASYLGFHLQRVNGLLDSEQARRRLVEASAAHDAALKQWYAVAGEILPDWADDHRDEIQQAALQLHQVTYPTGAEAEAGDEIAALAHALMQRLTRVKSIGPAGESLPLILDDSLAGLASELKGPLLEMLSRFSVAQQIVFLTEDAEVADWARVEAMTGEISFLEPSGTDDETVDVTQRVDVA